MKTLRKLILVLGGIAIAICLPGVGRAQSNSDALRAVVVRLRTHFGTHKKDETAAGLFVGKDQQYAYFITARHAVAVEVDNQEVHAQSADLWLYGSPQSVKALVFESTDAILDLGVVYLPVASLPPNLPQIVRKEAAVNVSVRIVGHPAAGDWSMWEGAVQNENAPNGDVHHFVTSTNPSLAKGYSGGPVFDPDGNFLGMHTDTTASYGRAAKSGEIVAQLKAWQVPTNNLPDVFPVSDEDAIRRVLRLYEEAYNQRDAGALWKIWPNASAKIKRPTEDYFRSVRSITRTVQQPDFNIAPDGRSATVRGQVSDAITYRNGSQQTLPERSTIIVFKKNGGQWFIDDIHY